MRVVVTGGAGFLGSHFCERLIDEGHEVVCFDNLLTGREENLAALRREPRFTWECRDVCEPLPLSGPVAAVAHLASPASPNDYRRYPIETLRAGSAGTYHALELARAQAARFLLASTSEVYGDPEVHPQTEDYWGRVNSVGPRACYDEAKRFSEAMTATYRRVHGLSTRMARIFNTYGARMRRDDGRVVPALIDAALKGTALTVFGQGTQTRSFCYVDDLIDGLWRLLAHDETPHLAQPINLGNPEEITILQIAQKVRAAAKSSAPIRFVPLPQDDPKRRRPDISRARALLDWAPRIGLDEGLRRTLGSFRGESSLPAAAA